jgi:hypothetical protein
MPRGRRSTLEDHPQREQILEAIARRVPVKVIAQQFGVTHWCLYRWIQAHRPRQDREERRALRKLKSATHTDHLKTVGGDDLDDKFRELKVQQQRLIAAQDFALKTGDLQRVATIADSIGRNIRHFAALNEMMRLRSQTPVTRFAASPEFQQLRADLLRGLAPEAAEHTEMVLGNFAAQTAPVIPDELEALY